LQEISLPGNSGVRSVHDVSYTAAIGEDSERDVRDARRLRQGQKEARGTREGTGRRRSVAQDGGRVELSEAETFWDGPHPSPRSRRPPRL